MNKIILYLSLIIVQSASAGIVFQADFNGTGGGTGGASDMVSLGGTGALFDASGTDDITSSISGGKLVITDGATDAGNAHAGARLSPTDTTVNGFDSWYTDGGSFDTINGAFDFTFRSTIAQANLVNDSFRFVDELGFGPNGAFRLILNTVGSNLRLQLNLPGETLMADAALGGTGLDYAPNTIYRVAATIETNGSGIVTTKLFLAEGDTTISSSGTARLPMSVPLHLIHRVRLPRVTVLTYRTGTVVRRIQWNWTPSVYMTQFLLNSVPFPSLKPWDSA